MKKELTLQQKKKAFEIITDANLLDYHLWDNNTIAFKKYDLIWDPGMDEEGLKFTKEKYDESVCLLGQFSYSEVSEYPNLIKREIFEKIEGLYFRHLKLNRPANYPYEYISADPEFKFYQKNQRVLPLEFKYSNSTGQHAIFNNLPDETRMIFLEKVNKIIDDQLVACPDYRFFKINVTNVGSKIDFQLIYNQVWTNKITVLKESDKRDYEDGILISLEPVDIAKNYSLVLE